MILAKLLLDFFSLINATRSTDSYFNEVKTKEVTDKEKKDTAATADNKEECKCFDVGSYDSYYQSRRERENPKIIPKTGDSNTHQPIYVNGPVTGTFNLNIGKPENLDQRQNLPEMLEQYFSSISKIFGNLGNKVDDGHLKENQSNSALKSKIEEDENIDTIRSNDKREEKNYASSRKNNSGKPFEHQSAGKYRGAASKSSTTPNQDESIRNKEFAGNGYNTVDMAKDSLEILE